MRRDISQYCIVEPRMTQPVERRLQRLRKTAPLIRPEVGCDLFHHAVPAQHQGRRPPRPLVKSRGEPGGGQAAFGAPAGGIGADDAQFVGGEQDQFAGFHAPGVPAEQRDGGQEFDAGETADRPGADHGEGSGAEGEQGAEDDDEEALAARGEAAVWRDGGYEDDAREGWFAQGGTRLSGFARAARVACMSKDATATARRKGRTMNLGEVRAFIEALARANPSPESELDYRDAFTLLVAVVLSAQATDAGVNKATAKLFAVADTPAAMAALGAEGIAPHIRTIGLWQGKARNVAALSQALLDHHGGQVPHDRAALEALPGVGRKTANVVLNVAFGEATMAVDTHVFRLGNRTGLAPGVTVRTVENGLVKRIPADLLREAHHLLILHGRYVCKARTAACWRCVAAAWCKFPDKTPPPREKPPKPG